MFAGWSNSSNHFVAIFATVPSGENYLLSFSTLPDKTNQNALNYIEFIKNTLRIYNKSLNNVLFLVGDNCSTNLSVANKVQKPFIGCASHRLNLAVNLIIEEEKNLITKVDFL